MPKPPILPFRLLPELSLTSGQLFVYFRIYFLVPQLEHPVILMEQCPKVLFPIEPVRQHRVQIPRHPIQPNVVMDRLGNRIRVFGFGIVTEKRIECKFSKLIFSTILGHF